MTIGQRIKKRRLELGMSQEELAKKIGYSSRSSINKIELDVQQLRQSKIMDIAQALNTTTAYIMGWEDVEASNVIIDRDEYLKKIMKIFEEIDDPHKARILAYAQAFYDMTKNKGGEENE